MPIKSNVPVSHRGECGVAMVEFSLVLPLLALFLFGVMDIGSMLNQYLVLTQVAHETARMGANTPGLQAGLSCRLSPDIDTTGLPSTALCGPPYATHKSMLDRAEMLARYSGLSSLYELRYTVSFMPAATVTSSSTTTTLAAGASGTPPSPGTDIVSVNIEAKYRAIFPLFSGASMGVRATAPYMY